MEKNAKRNIIIISLMIIILGLLITCFIFWIKDKDTNQLSTEEKTIIAIDKGAQSYRTFINNGLKENNIQTKNNLDNNTPDKELLYNMLNQHRLFVDLIDSTVNNEQYTLTLTIKDDCVDKYDITTVYLKIMPINEDNIVNSYISTCYNQNEEIRYANAVISIKYDFESDILEYFNISYENFFEGCLNLNINYIENTFTLLSIDFKGIQNYYSTFKDLYLNNQTLDDNIISKFNLDTMATCQFDNEYNLTSIEGFELNGNEDIWYSLLTSDQQNLLNALINDLCLNLPNDKEFIELINLNNTTEVDYLNEIYQEILEHYDFYA